MDKTRVDQLLVQTGQAVSRTEAQALIIAGRVFLGEKRIDKPGEKLPSDTELTIKEGRRFVSQGAFKLERALDTFGVDPKELTCLDLGASTGGFTELLLKRGAMKVYAVDVGKGQLDGSLRNDERVVVLEKTNARDLTNALVPEPISLTVADLSFISLKKVLEPCLPLLTANATVLPLFKPQFELGRRFVKKGGLALDFDQHAAALMEFAEWSAALGLTLIDLVHAPIRGKRRNVEYMLHIERGAPAAGDIMSLVNQRVEKAQIRHAENQD